LEDFPRCDLFGRIRIRLRNDRKNVCL